MRYVNKEPSKLELLFPALEVLQAWDVGLLGFLSCDSIATKKTNATGDISECNQSHIALCRNVKPLEFKDILIGFLAT
ncbi:uncharacterized [Tachysurus ichikawai]